MIREMLGIAEGILQDLHNDHSEVDTLFGEIEDCDNSAERLRLFGEVRSKLMPHLLAEQEVLYRRLERGKSEDSRRFAHEGLSEHDTVEKQLQKMANLGDPMSTQWEGEFKVLVDLVDHHVDEEETTGFSCARDEFDKEQLETLGTEFQARKAQLATRVA